jgi:hypothetical protein
MLILLCMMQRWWRGGIPAAAISFFNASKVSLLETLTSGGRLDWSKIRCLPKKLENVQGRMEAWAELLQLNLLRTKDLSERGR